MTNEPIDYQKFFKKIDFAGSTATLIGFFLKSISAQYGSIILIFGLASLAMSSIQKGQLKSERQDGYEKFVEKLGFFSPAFGLIGVLFKIQYWPWVDTMLYAFFVSILLIFIVSAWKQIAILKIIPSIEQYKILASLILCLVFL